MLFSRGGSRGNSRPAPMGGKRVSEGGSNPSTHPLDLPPFSPVTFAPKGILSFGKQTDLLKHFYRCYKLQVQLKILDNIQ